jgi:hypothetical protein
MSQEREIIAKMERGVRHFQEFDRLTENYPSGNSQVTQELDFEALADRVTAKLPEPPLEIAAFMLTSPLFPLA